MTTSQSTSSLNRLTNKIDSALHLTNELFFDFKPRIRHKNNRSISSLKPFDEMLDEYLYATMQDPLKYILPNNISSDFPFHEIIPKSAILDDKELFDTFVKSLMFDDEFIFESHRHAFWKGEFSWVKCRGTEDKVEAMLVHHKNLNDQDIIYSIRKSVLDKVRENVQKTWTYLKSEVKQSILDEFKDLEAWVPDDKSKVNEAASKATELTFYPMTDEVKRIFIEELEIIPNLDPVVKQEFIFDLRVLPDLDVYEWCEKMDLLRSCSRSTTKSDHFLQLHKTVETLENATTRNSTSLDYIVEKLKVQENTCTQICKQSSPIAQFDSKNSIFDKKVDNKSPTDKQVGSNSKIDEQVGSENPTSSNESLSKQLDAKNLPSQVNGNPNSEVVKRLMSLLSRDFSRIIRVNEIVAGDLIEILSYFQENTESLEEGVKTSDEEMKIDVKEVQHFLQLLLESTPTAHLNETDLTSLTARIRKDYNDHFSTFKDDPQLERIFDCNKIIFHSADDQITMINGVINWLDENEWLRYLSEMILPNAKIVKGEPLFVKFTPPKGKVLEAAALFPHLLHSQIEIMLRVQKKVLWSQKLIEENTRRGESYGRY